jgi:hypothetical protein
MASADLLLHPVRLRIVKAFLGDRALTTKQLAAELPDVPAGSIYRHVARLTEAGVLQVVAERRVRATTERTYTMRLYAAQMLPDEIAAMTLDEPATRWPRCGSPTPSWPNTSANSRRSPNPASQMHPEMDARGGSSTQSCCPPRRPSVMTPTNRRDDHGAPGRPTRRTHHDHH